MEPSLPGYRIVSALGKGAMATVYRAEHERLGKQVAIKVLDAQAAQDEDYRERFLREARAAARLNHANVVRALDAGIHEGQHYFVMELVEGEDLRSRLEREGRLGEHDALEIAREVAVALAEASRHGIVHRDVKPENILLSQDGGVKLADLGLAKIQGDASITREGYTLGTVAFLSPEQARGRGDLDVRTDLYALGATLYACFTGELPFGRGQNAPETMRRIIQDDPRPVGELAPVLSRGAVELVEALMAKDREDRPASAEATIERIDGLLASQPVPASGRRRTPVRRPNALREAFAVKNGGALALGVAALAFLAGAWSGTALLNHLRSSEPARAGKAPR